MTSTERIHTAAEESLYIGGQWVSKRLERLDVTNPATGEVVGTVPLATRAVVQQAIDAAYRAFPTWAALPARTRADLLKGVAARMIERIDELAHLMTLEQGKPLAEAKGEIRISADYFEWNAEESKRIYGDTIPAATSNKRLLAIRQPVGVCAAITPWNFPSSMIARKIGPALAAGCTVVVKPASATPLSALAIAHIFDELGVPPGVINVLVGPSSMVADELLESSKVRKISFTGSTEIGQQLMQRAAHDLKRVSLELGGHAPFIVFDDANLDQAIEGVIASKFRNAGQTCICTNRLYVQRGVYDQFSQRLAERVAQLHVGNGLEPSTDIGPLIDTSAVTKVEQHVNDAVKRGGRVLAGGSRASAQGNNFYQPTLVADTPDDALVAHEETFGPLLPLWSFDTDEEVIARANNTPYGLAAYVYGRDYARLIRAYEQLQYGIIGVNDSVPTVVQAPFGGVKHSGFGREGGHQGMDEYLDWKFVSIGL